MIWWKLKRMMKATSLKILHNSNFLLHPNLLLTRNVALFVHQSELPLPQINLTLSDAEPSNLPPHLFRSTFWLFPVHRNKNGYRMIKTQLNRSALSSNAASAISYQKWKSHPMTYRSKFQISHSVTTSTPKILLKWPIGHQFKPSKIGCRFENCHNSVKNDHFLMILTEFSSVVQHCQLTLPVQFS